MSQKKPRPESFTADLISKNLNKLTTNITYIVLFGFVLLLLIILITAVFVFDVNSGNETGKEWFALFKDGFLVLSGVLTTLIGYYFGNRGSDLAVQQIERIRDENEKLLSELRSFAPTKDEEDLPGMEDIQINP
jgi:hypothetical protein